MPGALKQARCFRLVVFVFVITMITLTVNRGVASLLLGASSKTPYLRLRLLARNSENDVESLFSSALTRARRVMTLVGSVGDEGKPVESPSSSRPSSTDVGFQGTSRTDVLDAWMPRPSNTYGRNPTVTTTALAHSQWSYIIRPGDTAIDATAGNGEDSLFLATLLFGHGSGGKKVTNEEISNNHELQAMESRLLCLDIDKTACEATRRKLFAAFPDMLDRQIQVLPVSHDPLPVSNISTLSIGLVCFNLGYLPNAAEKVPTETQSTLSSMAQSARLLRVGGMLSVMTYPGSNAPEDSVVRAFMTGLALFSSRTIDWASHVYLEDSEWNRRVLCRLHEARKHYGDHPVTWRVHEHKKLGRLDSPILLTATRIK
jgi:hypothetical protein